MPVAKRRTRGSGTPTDGAAWAATQTFARRACETCRWGVRCPEGLRFIDDALAAKRDGGARFAFTALWSEVKATFGYPLTHDALRLHYVRGCK